MLLACLGATSEYAGTIYNSFMYSIKPAGKGSLKKKSIMFVYLVSVLYMTQIESAMFYHIFGSFTKDCV